MSSFLTPSLTNLLAGFSVVSVVVSAAVPITSLSGSVWSKSEKPCARFGGFDAANPQMDLHNRRSCASAYNSVEKPS